MAFADILLPGSLCRIRGFIIPEDFISAAGRKPSNIRYLWDSFAKKAVGPKVMTLPSSPHPGHLLHLWRVLKAQFLLRCPFRRLEVSTSTALPLDFLLSLPTSCSSLPQALPAQTLLVSLSQLRVYFLGNPCRDNSS